MKPPKPPKKKKRPPVKPKPPKKPRKPPAGSGGGPGSPSPSALPAPNTTFDFPGSSIFDFPCHLEGEFEMATQHSHGDSSSFRWTHLCYVQMGLDVRDSWPSAPVNQFLSPSVLNQDGIPTIYLVVFVEVVNRNTPNAYQRLFLQRQDPDWPTQNI